MDALAVRCWMEMQQQLHISPCVLLPWGGRDHRRPYSGRLLRLRRRAANRQPAGEAPHHRLPGPSPPHERDACTCHGARDLGIDIGITGCQAVAFSEDGRTIASSYRGYLKYRKDKEIRAPEGQETVVRAVAIARASVAEGHPRPTDQKSPSGCLGHECATCGRAVPCDVTSFFDNGL